MRILVDAHVHLYSCFDLPRCFDSAWHHFEAAAGSDRFAGLLLLSETWRDQAFRELAALGDAGQSLESAAGGRWEVRRTGEPESLELLGEGRRRLFLIAGRQVQTAEGLEVLVIGSLSAAADGVPLRDVVEQARAADALPVIPWGFGKWWGRRGKLLALYLSEPEGELFLGDNGGRPVGYGEPSHFERARSRGIRILPGSDPLPLSSQAERAGSYGFAFEGRIDPARPCLSLKAQIREDRFAPQPFGLKERPLRFARHQILMQIRKQRPASTSAQSD